MKVPEFFALCSDCQEEGNCHHPEEVRWIPLREEWLCYSCYDEWLYETQGPGDGTLRDETWAKSVQAEAFLTRKENP